VRKLAVLFALCILAGCGKTGDPQPPFIRIPQSVTDLAARQMAYDAVLSWTNPAHYVDGSNATDLATVHVFRNGVRVKSLSAETPGKPQSYSLTIQDAVGVPQTFTVQVETSRGKLADMSNPARMLPMDVPGPVRELNAVVDQHRIAVQWQAPDKVAALSYALHREDEAGSHVLKETHYEDTNFEPGKKYTYSVVGARDPDAVVTGISAPSLSVEAVDRKAPAVPIGLQVDVAADVAILTWERNDESDLAGYVVYRSNSADGLFTQLGRVVINSYQDKAYQPGSFYRISAVDDSGNVSESSPAASP
jgi:hypothetical protein